MSFEAVAVLLLLFACSSSEAPSSAGPSPEAVEATAGVPSAATADWPAPVTQVSPASVLWLKGKGWWPLSLGYFADVPGYSAHYPVMADLHLLEKRGLEVRYTSYLSGPPILEAFLSGETQATHYGNLPFWTTRDKGVNAVAYALTGVNNEAALVVAPDSPFQSVSDLQAANREIVVATTLGSYAELYVRGVAASTPFPFRFAGMSMREAQLVPKGVDVVAIWDPHVSFALDKGLGRKIDEVYPHAFATGYEFLRGEIVESAPDVAQALADAVTEAVLAVRRDPERAAELYVADPRAKAWSKAAVRTQIDRYLTLYKPTYKYPDPAFWSREDERGVAEQAAAGRLGKALPAAELARAFAPAFLAHTYETLGWKVPERPVFLPDGWAGEVGRPPYPPYDNARTLATPQPWPEPGDLR